MRAPAAQNSHLVMSARNEGSISSDGKEGGGV